MYEGPAFYRHYKGNEYEVLGLGLEEATLAPVVVYKPLAVDQLIRMNRLYEDGVLFWTRPLDDFNAEVDGIPRFERTR